jgi:hypothetical protein
MTMLSEYARCEGNITGWNRARAYHRAPALRATEDDVEPTAMDVEGLEKVYEASFRTGEKYVASTVLRL